MISHIFTPHYTPDIDVMGCFNMSRASSPYLQSGMIFIKSYLSPFHPIYSCVDGGTRDAIIINIRYRLTTYYPSHPISSTNLPPIIHLTSSYLPPLSISPLPI